MSGLVEKLKPHKPLHEGAKVPDGTLLKEDNPEQATVDLSKIGGKCKSHHLLNMSMAVCSDSYRHHHRCPRRLHPAVLIARPGLRRAGVPVR